MATMNNLVHETRKKQLLFTGTISPLVFCSLQFSIFLKYAMYIIISVKHCMMIF